LGKTICTEQFLQISFQKGISLTIAKEKGIICTKVKELYKIRDFQKKSPPIKCIISIQNTTFQRISFLDVTLLTLSPNKVVSGEHEFFI